jgi:thiamine monophosphate kinase
VHVMAPDPNDKSMVYRWAVEWGGGGQLGQQGVTRDTLKPGDHVIITGSPGRNPQDHRLRMRTIFRPKDGWRWGGVVD